MTEKQIIAGFKALCITTLDPEAYACLVERIIPQLETNRSDLGRQHLESFFCRACQEKYAGIPCNDLGECTRCAGFDHERGE